jgi:3-phytase
MVNGPRIKQAVTSFRVKTLSLMAATSLILSACATGEIPVATRIANALPAVTVQAFGETVPVGTANDDAADDPAIWRNPANPGASLIVGTDKKAGIYVYDLSGKVRDFNNAGRVNNVDVRDGVSRTGPDGQVQTGILVVASDRNDLAAAKLALFDLSAVTGKLVPLGTVAAGAGEAYGVCLYRKGADLYAISVLKDGTIHQIRLDMTGASPRAVHHFSESKNGVKLALDHKVSAQPRFQGNETRIRATIERTYKLKTQSEGCVVDEMTSRLYVAEEDVGLWRFDLNAPETAPPRLIQGADGKALVADAEGVALADEGQGAGYIVVSSQGDNAYTVFNRSDETYVGRFRIGAGQFGATEETDGIELITGDFGPSAPEGLFVAQDGYNAQGAQNFKLVSWAAIKTALGLK